MPKILTLQQIAHARTLVGPLTAGMLVTMCDSHEQLCLERDVLTEEVERLSASLATCRQALADCLVNP